MEMEGWLRTRDRSTCTLHLSCGLATPHHITCSDCGHTGTLYGCCRVIDRAKSPGVAGLCPDSWSDPCELAAHHMTENMLADHPSSSMATTLAVREEKCDSTCLTAPACISPAVQLAPGCLVKQRASTRRQPPDKVALQQLPAHHTLSCAWVGAHKAMQAVTQQGQHRNC
jgi:hypothetical protein